MLNHVLINFCFASAITRTFRWKCGCSSPCHVWPGLRTFTASAQPCQPWLWQDSGSWLWAWLRGCRRPAAQKWGLHRDYTNKVGWNTVFLFMLSVCSLRYSRRFATSAARTQGTGQRGPPWPNPGVRPWLELSRKRAWAQLHVTCAELTLGPDCSQTGPTWSQVAACWSQVGPKLDPSWEQVGAKWVRVGPK